ncbi:hypothetical protein ACFWP2_21305 [Kitasatospora sp. NPDC058444]|uniref:hypothetical protein n=1 Tax=Kitasatospora sp. NPDC058444 TaxID=3346504 RepID=UPI003648139F
MELVDPAPTVRHQAREDPDKRAVTMPLPMFPAQIMLHTDQQNGQFLFVSNDTQGDDKVVEAHPYPGEFRNRFEAQAGGSGNVRLYNPATGCYLFVSEDDRGGDKVVEAHPVSR